MSKQEVETSGVGVYKFKNPTVIEGTPVKEITYDLTKINGKAIRSARSALGKRSYAVAIKELDEVFHAALFAEASDLSFDSVEEFSAVDYMAVADIVKDFLKGEA